MLRVKFERLELKRVIAMAADSSESHSFRFPAIMKGDEDSEGDSPVRFTPQYSPQDYKSFDYANGREVEAAQLSCSLDGGVLDVRVDSFSETWGGAQQPIYDHGVSESGGFRETPPPNHASNDLGQTDESRIRDSVTPWTPTIHAGTLGKWGAVVSYDACVRLCLNALSRGCSEALKFLENECARLRDAFGLQKVLLQPERELLTNLSPALSQDLGYASTPRRTGWKIQVQVRKMKVISDMPAELGMYSIKGLAAKLESACHHHLHDIRLSFSSVWKSYNEARVAPQASDADSSSCLSFKCLKSPVRCVKCMLEFKKSDESGNNLNAEVQENYSCKLRLKSYSDIDSMVVHPGSSESLVFFPESLTDDLIIEVLDSKGKIFGSLLAQVATLFEDPDIRGVPAQEDKLSWYPIYREPEHRLVGRLQVHITTTNYEDNNSTKSWSVAETVAYDLVMEIALKEQNFQQRNLLLDESWTWLLSEFALYYGVSDSYIKLRYVSYIMEVATPTAYCLDLVYELLLPVYLKGQKSGILSCQENRMLREIEVQLERLLGLVFENYKSLDESSLSGVLNFASPASGLAALALEPAVELYNLIHDISSPEAQTSLCQHFQAAARKRSKKHLSETDEYVSGGGEQMSVKSTSINAAYQKMETLCLNIRQEIYTDLELQSHHIIPSFVDLPDLSASIYSTDLCNRLRSFFAACPPPGPSSPVAELVNATADLQRDLSCWGISDVKGGVDAKQLFHPYIISWIQNTRHSLLASCKLEKVKWAGVRTQHATTPFLDRMYNHLTKTLKDFEVIICRWPEYIFPLEYAIADVEKEIVASLEIQYADDIAPLTEISTPRRISLKYFKKLSQGSICHYTVSDDLGILMNSLKRMLDMLHSDVETQVKLWDSGLVGDRSTSPGDRLSEITVLLRAKFRNYTKAIVDLLADNTKLQRTTKLKNILQEPKDHTEGSEIITRIQPLINLLTETILHLNKVFEARVFIQVCRVFWNRMAQGVQSFLDSKKESDSWYKGSRIVISVLDDLFASQLRHLQADLIEQKVLEAPQSAAEVRRMLSNERKETLQ